MCGQHVIFQQFRTLGLGSGVLYLAASPVCLSVCVFCLLVFGGFGVDAAMICAGKAGA